jgi:hypothetical protein
MASLKTEQADQVAAKSPRRLAASRRGGGFNPSATDDISQSQQPSSVTGSGQTGINQPKRGHRTSMFGRHPPPSLPPLKRFLENVDKILRSDLRASCRRWPQRSPLWSLAKSR